MPIFMGLCIFENEFLFVNNSRSEKMDFRRGFPGAGRLYTMYEHEEQLD